MRRPTKQSMLGRVLWKLSEDVDREMKFEDEGERLKVMEDCCWWRREVESDGGSSK